MSIDTLKVIKGVVISCFLLSSYAHASINDFSKLKSLSDNDLSYYAEKMRQRNMSVNGNEVVSSLGDMNLEQVNYNLNTINTMQGLSGSGIGFKQWKKSSFNNMNDSDLVNESYQNILSGKFAINNESNWVASINEGQSNLDSMRIFTGEFSSIKSQSYGLSLAYNTKIGDSIFFAYLGKTWIENKLVSMKSNYDGEQTSIGMGNYKTVFEDISFTSQMNIQKIQSSLFSKDKNNNNGQSNQTTATISFKSDYKVSKKVGLAASLDYERDLDSSGVIQTKEGNQQINDFLPNERIGVALTMRYEPVEKVNVVINFKHSSSSSWNNDTLKVGLNYNF